MRDLQNDRGSTYATWIYRDLMRKHQIRRSMSRKGDCWDNPRWRASSTRSKTELIMHCDYKTRDEARASLFDYMEVFYNRQRRHSAIKNVAPLVFEASTTA
jgi:transposase InsO family protein